MHCGVYSDRHMINSWAKGSVKLYLTDERLAYGDDSESIIIQQKQLDDCLGIIYKD